MLTGTSDQGPSEGGGEKEATTKQSHDQSNTTHAKTDGLRKDCIQFQYEHTNKNIFI